MTGGASGTDGGFTVRFVRAEDTLPLRREVLRGGDPEANVVSEADAHPAALHVGAFVEGRLVGVATSHPAYPPGGTVAEGVRPVKMQGVAVSERWRGRGAGTALVRTLLQTWEARGVQECWARARVDALGFYRRLGFAPEGERVLRAGRPHVIVRARRGTRAVPAPPR